mgnify:CR=1 FL=1
MATGKVILIFSFLALTSSIQIAKAQDKDPFESVDENGVVDENSAASEGAYGITGDAGTPASSFSITGIFGAAPAATPKKDTVWEDIDKEDPNNPGTQAVDQIYNNSQEVLINEELNRELPKREPFGDRLDDVEQRLGNE